VGRLFGTDGVRGIANADLTAELALGLSVAAAHVLGEAGTFAGHRPVAVVGRDPRASGEFLEAAVVAGLASAGVDVLRVGVLPTPAVAYLTGALGADLGVMLSASHNAMPDNGIKFLARGGHKLDDDLEDRIEKVYQEHRTGAPWDRPTGAGVGRVKDYDEGFDQYVAHLIGVLPNRLEGLKVVRTRRTAPRPTCRPRPSRGPAPRSSPSAPAPTASTSTTAAARPTWACSRPPS
jgi:phosphoglucosamine mutase